MEHSKDFEDFKNYYDRNLWNKAMLYNMIAKGKLTEEEYREIIGELEEE